MAHLLMRALSIRQPWAWCILHRGKDIENRTWKTQVRGRVLIHASQQFDERGMRYLQETLRDPLPSRDAMLRGGIVGSVEIVDCVDWHPSQWFQGPYGFVLRDATEMPFFEQRGRLGFFEVEFPANHGQTDAELEELLL